MRRRQGPGMTVMTIEECQKLEKPIRQDLELLDYEVRSIVNRIRNESRDAGGDDATFVKASTTFSCRSPPVFWRAPPRTSARPSTPAPSRRARDRPRAGPSSGDCATSWPAKPDHNA